MNIFEKIEKYAEKVRVEAETRIEDFVLPIVRKEFEKVKRVDPYVEIVSGMGTITVYGSSEPDEEDEGYVNTDTMWDRDNVPEYGRKLFELCDLLWGLQIYIDDSEFRRK